MFKNLFQGIGQFFKNLFSGNFKITSDGSIGRSSSSSGLLSNSSYEESSNPYSGVSSVGGLYDLYNSVGPGTVDSLINKETEAGITGQQAGLNEMQLDNMRRQYGFQVAGMKEAGLNPALMYGSGASTAPSAPSASQGMSMSDLMQAFLLPTQLKSLKADIAVKDAEKGRIDAETNKLSQDTANAKQQFDFNEIINPLKVEAQRVANNLSRAETDKVYKQIDEIGEAIKKTIAETDSEKERKKLYTAQAILTNANARQVIEMLPYSKALAEAQTAQAYAQASLASVQAAYQQKLIDAGQVEAVIAELEANAKSAEDKSRIQRVKSDIYTGTYVPDYSGSWLSDVNEWLKGEVVAPTLAGIVQFVDNINPLNGMLK